MAKTTGKSASIDVEQLRLAWATKEAELTAAADKARSDAMADVLADLTKDKEKFEKRIAADQIELDKINDTIRSITGEKKKGKGGKSDRKNPAEKMVIAGAVYRKLEEANGKELAASDLPTGGVPMGQLVKMWNDANKDRKIKDNGAGSRGRKYLVK